MVTRGPGVAGRWRTIARAAAAFAGGALLLNLHGTASLGAAQTAAAGRAGTDVVQVVGRLDPANVSLIERALHDAESARRMLLVFQLDAGGALDTDVTELIDRFRRSPVPIAVWVGPSGAHAQGAAALLAESAPVLSLSSGSSIGPVVPVRLDRPGHPSASEAEVALRTSLELAHRSVDAASSLTKAGIGSRAARARRVIDRIDPVLGDLIVGLDGKTVATARGPVKLSTAKVVTTSAGRRRQPRGPIRFAKLDLGGQLLHTLSTPWVAYFLFVTGLALIVFEFFTASVGIAGAVGAIALVGACSGFSHLPVRGWAIALLVLSLLGFSIDIQAGGLGPWTAIALVSLVAGSLGLYGGSSRLDPTWWTVALVCLGTALFMIGGMTAMLRSRFSTPTVGREGMVGELGTAEADVAPDGMVRVRGALWRARTNRATPVAAGDTVRVVSIEGLVLEVEPESGGARDYRDRARHPD